MTMPDTDTSVRQTRDQERATAAWDATPAEPSEEYVSLVRGAGASIMTMGLGQTLAFYQAKGKDHHRQLADALAAWLLEDAAPDETGATGTDLMTAIRENDSAWYRRQTTEALAYLTWLKRFAEANLS